jgi:hypothetical protein
MADQAVPSIQNPYDCIEKVVHKLRPDEVRLVLAAINYYVVVKTGETKQEALKEYFAGTWIERAAAERGLNEEGRPALAIGEATRALWGWLDKEPFLAREDRKHGAALLIAHDAMKRFDVPLAIFLASFISMADEATIATALEDGRAIRDNQRAERRAALRIVT